MQVGIMSGTFVRPSLEESLDAILAHDIRCLQFNLSTLHVQDGSLADKLEAARVSVRPQLEKRGMSIAAMAAQVNMVDPNPRKRQEGIERVKLFMAACQDIGTSVLATCTGSRNPQNMWRTHPDNDSDETWAMLRDTLAQLLPEAEAHGVTLAFEPEVCQVASSSARSRRLIDEMGSPNLKVVLDAANLFGKGDLPRMSEVLDEAFELLGDHVAIAHAKDLDHDGDAGHLAAGTGKLDYERYVSLLCGLPFDVPVILHGLSEMQVEASAGMLRRLAAAHRYDRKTSGVSPK